MMKMQLQTQGEQMADAENGCDNDSNDKDKSDNDEDAGRRRTDGRRLKIIVMMIIYIFL